MKTTSTIIVSFILVLICVMGARGQDAELGAKVEELFKKADRYTEAKDVEATLSLLADDYQEVFMGVDRMGMRTVLGIHYSAYEELRAEYTILDVTRSGEFIKAAVKAKLEGKSHDGFWNIIHESPSLSLLVEEGESLKIFRSTETDTDRLDNVQGQTYRDKQIGFSFTAPKNWEILPTVAHPMLQRSIFVLAPDMSSAVMMGYVKAAGVSPQKAAEGDEAVGKIMSDPKTYELIKSGPITIDGHKGFEIESKFFIAIDGRERHRRRVYFNAGGRLYVLCFDAMPFKQWNQVRNGFQSIIDSIKLGE